MSFTMKQADALIHATHSVDLDGATSVVARIRQAIGDLAVRGGAPTLMTGDFTYPEPFEPVIEYRVNGGIGKLDVDHKRPRRSQHSDGIDWAIALNDDVPLALHVSKATGDGGLDLSTLNLSTLDLDHATGDTTLDLSGDHAALTNVQLTSATGDLHAELTGRYSRLSRLKVGASTGAITLNLGGSWESDLDASIDVATGQVRLLLPESVGAEVKVSSAVSRISAKGMHQDGKVFRNEAFGTAPVTLRVVINAAVSTVTLETVG